MNGKEVENCTTEDFRNEDLTRPCELFARELEFKKQYHLKLNTMENKTRYMNKDINDLVKEKKAPMEIVIKELQSKVFFS